MSHYKSGSDSDGDAVAVLWDRWATRFSIRLERPPRTDGALDALVCATVGDLYHRAPETLLHLREPRAGEPGCGAVRGRGPFYVVAPRD